MQKSIDSLKDCLEKLKLLMSVIRCIASTSSFPWEISLLFGILLVLKATLKNIKRQASQKTILGS